VVRTATALEAGRLGRIRFDPGCYAYVGSAFGPGGLEARINRHLRNNKRRHWHIDYLLESADVVRIWTITGNQRLECILARLLAKFRGARVVTGFGASDCNCVSHLVALPRVPSRDYIRRRLHATDSAMIEGTLREITP
jgi:Uri superfamily endonuclease